MCVLLAVLILLGLSPTEGQEETETGLDDFALLGLDTAAVILDPALGAALNWYRANIADRQVSGPAMGVVRVPTMFTWSDGDTALCIDGAELTEEYVDAPYRFEVIEGVSHWIPDLATDQMTELLLDHINTYSER